MPTKHMVKCKCCGKTFDANAEKYYYDPKVRRYMHLECKIQEDTHMSAAQKDKNDLMEYIGKLFEYKYNRAVVNSQLQRYTDDFFYTYKGIKETLVYAYELKKLDINKSHGNLGIVPIMYKEATTYYRNLRAVQKDNEQKVKEFVIKQNEVVILPPQRQPRKRELFTFLDEEEENNEF